MRNTPRRLALAGAIALAISVTVGCTLTEFASAKKKKAGGTADLTMQVNQPVPDGTTDTNGLLTSTISVGGKRFKGTVIRDVNVTLQTTGSSTNSATQVDARLTAPNGMTTWLLGDQLSGQSIGPLTLDDQSPNRLGGTQQRDPTMLVAPYAGSAQPDCFNSFGVCTFWPMNGGPASGTWTLRVYDVAGTPAATSILNFWRLTVVAGKPYLTK